MREAHVDVKIEYSAPNTELFDNEMALSITFFVISVLLMVYAYRVWSGNAYYEIQGVPQDENVCLYYLKVWLLYARLCVHLFFPLVFAVTSYILIFFKLQEDVFMLLPRENREDGMGFNYYPVRTVIITMWAFQTGVVAKLVLDQCGVDIFFIDWERARARASQSTGIGVADKSIAHPPFKSLGVLSGGRFRGTFVATRVERTAFPHRQTREKRISTLYFYVWPLCWWATSWRTSLVVGRGSI